MASRAKSWLAIMVLALGLIVASSRSFAEVSPFQQIVPDWLIGNWHLDAIYLSDALTYEVRDQEKTVFSHTKHKVIAVLAGEVNFLHTSFGAISRDFVITEASAPLDSVLPGAVAREAFGTSKLNLATRATVTTIIAKHCYRPNDDTNQRYVDCTGLIILRPAGHNETYVAFIVTDQASGSGRYRLISQALYRISPAVPCPDDVQSDSFDVRRGC